MSKDRNSEKCIEDDITFLEEIMLHLGECDYDYVESMLEDWKSELMKLYNND